MTTTARTEARPALPDDVVIRPATAEDLPACAEIWRDGINDYLRPLHQPEVPSDTAGLSRLHAHCLATDPDGFRIAVRAGRPIAFGVAVRRGRLWFLSMLFVRPGEQARGLGRALLEGLLPPAAETATLATATDVLQPISNALYARYGMVPRMPILDLIGLPTAPDAFGVLPAGVDGVAFEEFEQGVDGSSRLASALDGLDRELLGDVHPQDHAYVRADGRRGFLFLETGGRDDQDGPGDHDDPGIPGGNRGSTVLGYGYASPSGRLGPVAVRDPALLAPVLGHIVGAVEARGAFAVWVPGAADGAIRALLAAGFRLDGFPLLLGWNREPADFGRYLPISPGLL